MGQKNYSIERKQAKWGLIFTIPCLIFFAVFSFYPIINALITSLTNRRAIARTSEFVGLENYIKRLEKLEEIANSFDGVEKCYAVQAGREIRIMVRPEVIGDDKMTILARDIVNKIESELEYPGQIKVNIIRESRAVDYAK